jgi:preprotein translocase subunit SecG
MSTFEVVLLMLLVVDAIALAGLVLLQQGKGADVGAAFGSGAANTMFGSSGSASFLTKLTVWLAIGFFIISFGLAWTAKDRAARLGSVGVPQVQAPVVDAQAPAAEEPAADTDVPADTGAAQDVPQPAERLTPEGERVDSDIPDV